MKMNYFFYALILLLLIGCTSEDEKEIVVSFNRIKRAEKAEDIIKLLNKNSMNYFTQLGEIAVRRNQEEINDICNDVAFPLFTRYLLKTLELMAPSDTTLFIDADNVVGIATLVDFGLIGYESRSKFKFGEIVWGEEQRSTSKIKF